MNLSKSRVYFSIELSRKLGIHSYMNLGKYLGVSIIHGRITKNTYNKVVERVQNRLVDWKVNYLSAGRIMLNNSMISIILVYAMQTTKISGGICDHIE